MKGGVKVYSALRPLERDKPSRGIKVYRNTKRKSKTFGKHKYRVKSKLKTLKRKIKETEEDTTDIGVIKSFLLCKKFIKTFLKRYDMVMNSNDVEKQTNYDIFASMLAANISSIVEEYSRIIDDEKLLLNTNEKLNILYKDPEEYLEEFIDFIEEDDTVEDFAKIATEYYEKPLKSNANMKNTNNNNNNTNSLRDEYLEYYWLLHDTSKGVISVIKKFSLELKSKKKIANNVDINSLIMGLTAVKIKGAENVPKRDMTVIIEKSKNNNNLDEDFFSRFMKLGL
jgi:hypothetical protein